MTNNVGEHIHLRRSDEFELKRLAIEVIGDHLSTNDARRKLKREAKELVLPSLILRWIL